MTKIEFDDNWNTWTVQNGYYGVVDTTRTTWVVEYAGDKANAERIVRNSDVITAELVKANRKHTRLSITFNGDTMMITNYDWDKIIAGAVPAVA